MNAPEPRAVDGGLLRFITAGSVDDGKSTLIGRLLHDTRAILSDQLASIERVSKKRGLSHIDFSLLTDGLEAEREQGITIDVAYRYFATPKRKFIIGDSPGHVEYIRNMVTAASTADVAVLLVDARKGIQPQTRRHVYLARWLGIADIVLAVNKMDLVGYERAVYERHRAEFLALAGPMGFEDATIIPMSALAGDMVVERGARLSWYGGPSLLDYLEQAPALRHRVDADFRFPVQRVVRPSGGERAQGPGLQRGYQGTVAAGRIRVGDEVQLLPSRASSRVCAIGIGDADADAAHADQAVTLYLADALDVSRGDMLAGGGVLPRATKRVAAELCWLSAAPFSRERSYLLKHTTRTVGVASMQLVKRIDIESFERVDAPETLRMNDLARVEIDLRQPICVDCYAADRTTGSFILIDALGNDTLAAGIVL
jgi:sulfate adenylyltransferase subunit 1